MAAPLLVLALVGSARAQGDPRAPLTAFQARKAEALLARRLPCLGCHVLDGAGGRIGPDLSDVGGRRSPEYIAAMISEPERTRPGTLMPRPAMPEGWRDLLTRYLVSRGGPVDGEPPPATPAPAHDTSGAALYVRHCAACHGPEGRGDGPNAPYLADPPTAHADSAFMSTRPDDTIYDGIAAGAFILGKSHLMPAFGETLTREQIRSLVRYIRRLCRCEGPAWSRDGR